MRGLKGELSGVSGSELLSILLASDGSKPELDNCVAQVAAIEIGDSSVMAVALAPRDVFETDGKPASVSGLFHACWSRMMVWRPEGAKNNGRAEATLLRGLVRDFVFLDRPPEAIAALCGEIFGDQEHELMGLISECQETGEKVTHNEIYGCVTSRPMHASEFQEISALVPEDWRPVLERRANWESPEWRDLENARMGPVPSRE
ncbi:hypothetical protein GNI_175570 [Gregarina niphandrodes]|uniref:Uncharacterized protein n=1 Tax=Gregarina niphandrodes TaxID=110365 RepID=A0A023AXK3_GRENI|nr:hypothetical protein GNI_175570 [Gregarina niphandrodes]EZG43366.1 hypothetical protein GNI_175570 [Gregarina niphandrodes]|eukprot:XP_011134659.1 hypothetical protein GNI_175570 [Gregarina niphandrodes]